MYLNGIAAASGTVFFLVEVFIFASAVRRSSFGWLVVVSEYFYFLGLGIFPILLGFGVIDTPVLFSDNVSSDAGFGIGTFFHIFLYSVGALCGYYLARPIANKVSLRVICFTVRNKINNYWWFYFISGTSIFFGLLFFYFVGVEEALVNSSLVRAGGTTGLEDFDHYLFLKRLAMIGMCSIIFVPYIIIENRRILSTFLIISTVGILIYFETVSRAIILDLVGVFFVLYFSLNPFKWRFILLATPVLALLVFVFVYGKIFVAALASYYFLGNEFVLAADGVDSGFSYFIAHFAHLIYSVDAGIRNFFLYGPVIPNDVLLSPLGLVPSFVFSGVGLESLSYHLVGESEKLSCINTNYILRNTDQCTIPPYLPGATAYLFPFVGAFLFGFLRFLMYSSVEICWLKLKGYPELLWFPYFLFLVSIQVMLVIPNTISFAVFLILMAWFLLSLKKVRL